MSIKTETIFPTEMLNKVYRKWLVDSGSSLSTSKFASRRSYDSYRYGFNEQLFENWLFLNGFDVIQENKQRYLRFSGDQRSLTLFLLKHVD